MRLARCSRLLTVLSAFHLPVSSTGDGSTTPTASSIFGEDSIAAFRERGHVLTRGLLDNTQVAILADRLRGILADHGRSAFGDEPGRKEVRFTFAVHELDAFVAEFIGSRAGRLHSVAARLAGTPDLCVLMDRGFSKDPGDPETHWHRDDEAVGLPAVHAGLRTVHAWIPLTSMSSDMGTLQYLVGTHRRSFSWFERTLASLWGWDFVWFATSPVSQDDTMALGDVAWHDGWVVHSAGPNRAGAVRDGLAVSFAYCLDPTGCASDVAPTSPRDPSCHLAERLFDAEWLARHRSGESDYAKTALEEPRAHRALRFLWRSLCGALLGLALHWLATSCYCTKSKPS